MKENAAGMAARSGATALVLAGVVLTSFSAILVKAIRLTPTNIALYRTGIATLILATLTALLPDPEVRRLREGWLQPVLYTLAAGLFFGADLFIWFRSINLVGAGLATLFTNTQVFWVVLVSAALCGERLSVRFALCAVGAVGGITCITLPGLMGSTLDPYGTFIGLCSAPLHASYVLLLRRSQQHESRLHVVPNLMVSTFSSTVTLMALAVYNGEPLPYVAGLDRESFIGVVSVALFVQVGGWILFSRGLPALPAGVASLILLMNPPLTMMWAWLVFDERLTPLDLFGGMVTLACIYYGSEPAKKGAPQDGATEQDGKGLKKQLGAINDDEDA